MRDAPVLLIPVEAIKTGRPRRQKNRRLQPQPATQTTIFEGKCTDLIIKEVRNHLRQLSDEELVCAYTGSPILLYVLLCNVFSAV